MSALHYTIAGPPGAQAVLLLHGLGACGDDWQLQLPVLVDRYRVIVVDLPGHRHSPPRGLVSIARMAAAVDTLLDTLAIDRVHVVGLSLGGCVALALALRTPPRVRSLVLVNTFARLRPSSVSATLRGAKRLLLLLGAPMRVVAAHVAREAFPAPDQAGLRQAAIERLAANRRDRYLRCLLALLRFDVRRRLGEIRCPTLVVAGTHDTTVPFAAKQTLARGIRGALLRVVDGSGHVTPFDQADAFNRLLLAHLAGVERP